VQLVGSQEDYPLPGIDTDGSTGRGRQLRFAIGSTRHDNAREGWRACLVREAAGRFLVNRLPEAARQQVMLCPRPPLGAIGGC
jgi:hypothetical protein